MKDRIRPPVSMPTHNVSFVNNYLRVWGIKGKRNQVLLRIKRQLKVLMQNER